MNEVLYLPYALPLQAASFLLCCLTLLNVCRPLESSCTMRTGSYGLCGIMSESCNCLGIKGKRLQGKMSHEEEKTSVGVSNEPLVND